MSLDGDEVTMVRQIKILGVIIDARLSFINHAKYVIAKVTKTFKNLCKFVRPSWGVCSANVVTIYRHVIEPTITYAAGIWGTAVKYKCVRRQLRSFQRSFAIRAIRGFHTISAVSAMALAQFMPLHLKVTEVSRIEKVKLTGKFDVVIDEDDSLESKLAPNALLHPATRQGIDYFHVATQEESDEVASDVKIFTDGSKLENGKTGAAMVIFRGERRKEVRKFKLADHCTVYQAEMFAIHEAVRWAVTKGNGLSSTIFSDSRSSLDAIKDRSHNSTLGTAIHSMLSEITGRTSVNFAWIKAHVGISGNEAADEAAKQATEKHSAPAYISFPISYVKKQVRDEEKTKWRHEYISSVQGSTTRLFLPTLDDARSFVESTELTFEMTQILTGHCFCKEYLKKFKISNSDECPCEKEVVQSVTHLLMSCPRYENYRRQYFDQCEEKEVHPLKLRDVANAPHLLESFALYTQRIISTLKEFNST